MQADGFSDAAKRDPPLSKPIREPIDPRRESESASPHSSPRGEELSQAAGSSPRSASAVWRSSHVALPSQYRSPQHRAHHIAGEPNTNMSASSNPIAQPKASQSYAPQLRASPSGMLSPIPTGNGRAVNTLYTPLRLDSQLLGSPWPGSHLVQATQSMPSPTRANSGPGGSASSSNWNAASTPVPYPCGSPTAYGNGIRIMSPSAHSLRQQQQQQQQLMHNNDDSSPAQLSISTTGRESSFISTMPAFASPSTTALVHTAILDAPLQVSLVPPPCGDEYPYFSFGNSILQSTPFTPTVQSPSSRSHSIYRDAMAELSQQKQELDNPLSLFQAEPAHHREHGSTSPSPAGGGVSSASLTPLTVDVGDLPHRVPPPRATSEASFASAVGASVPRRIVDGMLVDWTKLGQMSPPSPCLPEPLTARPKDDDNGAMRHGPKEDVNDSHRSSCNSTPEEAPTSVNNESLPLNIAADEDDAQVVGELGSTKRPHETDAQSDGPDEASDSERHSGTAVSLSDANLAYHEGNPEASGSLPQSRQQNSDKGVQIATPQTTYSRRQCTHSSASGAAPPNVTLQLGAPDLHLFMPSPVDESAQGFAPLRDGMVHHSPSEHSASVLSLVPHLGVWQASPTLVSMWHSVGMSPSTAPSVRTSMTDLLEVLRLLQSDVSNVYSRVSVNEHTVRHWASCTLSALLHLTVEVAHGVQLSAIEEAETVTAPEQALTFAEVCSEIQEKAKRCGETLRGTVQAVQRDRDVLEPMLLTSMLARGAITSLLHSLERAYTRSENAPMMAPAGSKPADARDAAATAAATATATTTNTSIPANRRVSSVVPIPSPLTAERISDLMDSTVLAKELGGEWRQFASDYNRKLFRYLFLRALSAQLDKNDKRASSAHNEDTRRKVGGAPVRRGSTPTTLRTIETAWVDDQLKRWGVIFQHKLHPLKADRKGKVKSELLPQDDEADVQLFREAFCQDFPSYTVVSEVFSAFREGESWRCWYILLGQAMECSFRAQDNKDLLKYVEEQMRNATTASAAAASHAVRMGQITLEQVEEALESVEASLVVMQEQGKARRVDVLKLFLRRIFMFSVVSSVHRALGKDAVVSDAQLATYVQVQRKSLEEVEAQLTAEHAEAATHIKCIGAFLAHFSNNTAKQVKSSLASLDGASNAHLYAGTTTLPISSPDSLWNTSSVGSLGSLLARVRSNSGSTERNDESEDSCRSDEDAAQKRRQDDLSLVRDVSVCVVDTITSLCALLQSEVNVTAPTRPCSAAPTKMPIPSTRALRRLQASLLETHRAVIVGLASLHSA